jgi:hypothetical protein
MQQDNAGNEIQRVYRPELIPRRGEAIAWIGVLLTGVTWAVLAISGRQVVIMIPVLFILLVFSAFIISLGNWMDRKTEIRMNDAEVEYRNGLRQVHLRWMEIWEVRVLPGKWGKKVQVYGDSSYFAFHTLGEVRLRENVKGRMGFEQGEEILRQLVLRSGLQIVEQQGDGYYYARQ